MHLKVQYVEPSHLGRPDQIERCPDQIERFPDQIERCPDQTEVSIFQEFMSWQGYD